MVGIDERIMWVPYCQPKVPQTRSCLPGVSGLFTTRNKGYVLSAGFSTGVVMRKVGFSHLCPEEGQSTLTETSARQKKTVLHTLESENPTSLSNKVINEICMVIVILIR